MKIEQQVCTLEQAKKLKELGVSKVGNGDETGFYFWTGEHPKDKLYYEDAFPDTIDAVAAFTVAELGVMMGKHHPYGNARHIMNMGDRYEFTMKTSDWKDWEKHPTEAQARAAMLIYLLENKLTTSEEVNKRLRQ